MNKQAYENLCNNNVRFPQVIGIEKVQQYQTKDGTLLWGYTCDRNSFHVYLKKGEIHRVIYTFSGDVLDYIHDTILEAELLHPNKRIYPEASSFDFIISLRMAGCNPSLANFNDDREASTWYGKTREELNDTPSKL